MFLDSSVQACPEIVLVVVYCFSRVINARESSLENNVISGEIMMKKILDKNRVIDAPEMSVVGTVSFQRRLAMTLRNLPEPKSRRALRIDVQMTLLAFKGMIILPNGYPYPRETIDSVLGDESGGQISKFLNMENKPSSITFPRLQIFYCYVEILWPHLAAHIMK